MTTIRDRFLQRRDRLRTREDRTVLDALSDGERWFLFRLCDRTKLRTGRAVKALARLRALDLVEAGHEARGVVYPSVLPGRVWYRITDKGRFVLTLPDPPALDEPGEQQ